MAGSRLTPKVASSRSGSAASDPLAAYRRKRDFSRTQEPDGDSSRARRPDADVEDRPLEYFDFEMHGEKLRGRFVLVRTKTDASGKEMWLLLHKHDQRATDGWNPEEHPRSVLRSRTNDDVKVDPDRMWRSDLAPPQASVALKTPAARALRQGELDELDALESGGTWRVFDRDLRVTNLDKVLFPPRAGEEPVTKRDLLRYSAQGPSTDWADLLVLARLHRSALEHLGVQARAKLTGRRGIQIWIPIRRGPSFGDTRAWVEQLSRTVGAVVPELVSWKWQVVERGGLARLDYTQNAINKTLVAPYSPRPAPGAPVSSPIEWEELEDASLAPDGFTIRTVLPRIAEQGDLFRGVLDFDQELPAIH